MGTFSSQAASGAVCLNDTAMFINTALSGWLADDRHAPGGASLPKESAMHRQYTGKLTGRLQGTTNCSRL